MKPATILKKAADLLEKKGWCRGTNAKDNHGAHVFANDPTAVRFCAMGAIEKVGKNSNDCCKAIDLLKQFIPDFFNITAWNDNQTDKRKIIRTLRRASSSDTKGE